MTYYNNHNLSQSKTEPKFYPLQMEEHLKACRELNSTQRAVYYYLNILSSEEGFLDINTEEIAKDLELSKRTVSSALKTLDRLGWINYSPPRRTLAVLIH